VFHWSLEFDRRLQWNRDNGCRDYRADFFSFDCRHDSLRDFVQSIITRVVPVTDVVSMNFYGEIGGVKCAQIVAKFLLAARSADGYIL
jgi:hypothetical protein